MALERVRIVLDADVIMLMTEKQCAEFISDVTARGSRLPKIETILKYVPNVAL